MEAVSTNASVDAGTERGERKLFVALCFFFDFFYRDKLFIFVTFLTLFIFFLEFQQITVSNKTGFCAHTTMTL